MNGDEIGWLETAFRWLVGLIGSGLAVWSAWLMNAIAKNREEISNLDKLIRAHELEDARTYVSKQDFKETVIELKDTVKRVYDKMDQITQALANLKK